MDGRGEGVATPYFFLYFAANLPPVVTIPARQSVFITSSLDILAILLATRSYCPSARATADALRTTACFAVPAVPLGVPYGEDITLGADADLYVCVFADPAIGPDSFIGFCRDIGASRCVNSWLAIVFVLLIEEIEGRAIQVLKRVFILRDFNPCPFH